jgi:hypothetical protein
MSLTLVPALNDSNDKKTVGESVDDSVHNKARLAAPPQKKSPGMLSHVGAPMLQIQ